MPKKLHTYVTIAAASAVLISGCSSEKQAGASAGAQRPPAQVSTVEIKQESITLERELPGRTVAFLVAEVRPQVTGIIQDRLFEEGSQVTQGQSLYQLDDAIYQADLKQAQASLKVAETAASLAKTNSDRITGLYEAKAVSQQEYDNAVSSQQQAEAQLALAQATLTSAQVTLDYSHIISPITGYIGKSSVTKGALVTANQSDSLAIIQQIDPIYVDVNQSGNEMLRLRKAIANGDLQDAKLPVTIMLADGTPYEHLGEVAFSDFNVNQNTGSITLRVEVPNPDSYLLPGMYVKAVIGEGIREDSILVPQKAVARAPNGSTSVMVVKADNTVESRAVQLGRSVGNSWLVQAGLNPGENVVTEGLQKIRSGSQVQIAASTEAAH